MKKKRDRKSLTVKGNFGVNRGGWVRERMRGKPNGHCKGCERELHNWR